MVTKNKIGRPPKTFKPKPKKNIIRPRGRPRKNEEKHNKTNDITKTFVLLKNKIISNSIVDNIALGLLVFSMLLIIFSISIKGKKTINQENLKTITTQDQIENKTNETQEQSGITNNIKGAETPKENTEVLEPEKKLIYRFYQKINDRNFDDLNLLTDNALRQSNTYKTYYSSNWLSKFLNNLSEENIFISDVNEVPNKEGKSKKYEYQLSFTLKSGESFSELRSINIVERNNIMLIGSIMCINKGCSLSPFFSPQRYGIQ